MQNKSSNPYLSGNFAPVLDELTVQNLEIIGEIPNDLTGIYMRNGPNPQFPPISYTYPFDGDGMIHAVYIDSGIAHYRNRYVETRGLLKERKAGGALYGGVLKPVPLAPQWVDPEDEPVAVKNGAFIHIIRHAGQYLAMSESAPAYAMTEELTTLGEWTPHGATEPLAVSPHSRLDPLTGELWFINYSLILPYLSIYQLDATGKVAQKWDIEKPHATMIHDFVLTKNYVIIFDCPVIFDLKQMIAGGAVLNWRPESGVRIGIMPRSGGKMQWLATEPFFVFHFANAYESANEIIIDYVRYEKFALLTGDNNAANKPPMLYRSVINLQSNFIKHTALDDRIIEFPRIREDHDSLPHQFIYTLTKTTDVNNKRAFNALIKYDVKNQRSQLHDFGQFAEIGEAVFAPGKAATSEDDGYVMLFVYDSTIDQSELVILDATHFTAVPLARIKMPRRVPQGLHGSWLLGAWKELIRN